MMQQDTVERRKWLSNDEFAEILGMTNMLPGPNSTELAIHIGYVKGGRIGAILGGLAFTLPAFFMMLVLSWLYFSLGSIPSISGVFYGLNPVVMVLIFITGFRLGTDAVKDYKLLGILTTVFLVAYLTPINEAILLLSAGLAGILLYGPLKWRKGSAFVPALLLLPLPGSLIIPIESLPPLLQLFLEFLKAGSLLFGTGLVIIPLVGPDMVELFKWMDYKEFFDGVTLGQVTPGPVVKTAAFVGYKVAGILGASIATFGIFLPPFVLVTTLAPVFRTMRNNVWLQGFLKGVRMGAIGTIFAVALTLAQTALIDVWTILIAGLSLPALTRFRVSISVVVLASAMAGVLLTLL